MAAPVWATDLTDLWVGGAITNWTAWGGGPAALNQETDFFIEEPDCCSKNAWAGDLRGMNYDDGGPFTVDSDGAIIIWGFFGVANSLETKANGGFRVTAGSSVTDFSHYYMAGGDELLFSTWVPYALYPHDSDTIDSDAGTTDHSAIQVAGVAANVKTPGPTKGAPLAGDVLRYGRCILEYTEGDSDTAFNTFSGADAFANDSDTVWGLLELDGGVYRMQGLHRFGDSDSSVDFRDADKTMVWRPVEKVSSNFNRIEIVDSDTFVQWDNITFLSLSTVSPGDLVVTAGVLQADACQFVDMRDFTFTELDVVTNSTFRGCRTITAPDTLMSGSQILVPAVDSDASALIWDDSDNPDSDLADMSFSQGATNHHAIEFGTNASISMTLRGIDFAGFEAADDLDGSTLFIANTDSDVTITINLVSCTGNISFKSAGAAVVLVVDPVTLTVTVTDTITMDPIVGARVVVYVNDSDNNLPYLDLVTMTRDSDLVTVTHAAHGMATSDKVRIQGADQAAYRGIHQITVLTAGSYTYLLAAGELPTSPATGTITATFVLIDGGTNGSGVITATRSYSADQSISGQSRKSSSAPFYKTAAIVGTINSASGLGVQIGMALDQ